MPSQNDRYKAAVGQRNVGSQTSKQQISNAQNTAIGRTRGTITKASRDTTSSEGRMTATSVSARGRSARGSWEGYQHAPSTHLEINGTGYRRPSMQTARNNLKRVSIGDSSGALQGIRKPASFMTDHRMVGRNARSSISKLNKIIKSKF